MKTELIAIKGDITKMEVVSGKLGLSFGKQLMKKYTEIIRMFLRKFKIRSRGKRICIYRENSNGLDVENLGSGKKRKFTLLPQAGYKLVIRSLISGCIYNIEVVGVDQGSVSLVVDISGYDSCLERFRVSLKCGSEEMIYSKKVNCFLDEGESLRIEY